MIRKANAEKCFEIDRELAKKYVSSLQQVVTPCIDDHHVPREDCETTGEFSAVCAQTVLKCLYLLWSADVVKLHPIKTKNYRQFCHVESQIEDCKLGYSKTLHLQVTCGIENHRHEVYCAYLDHTGLFTIFWLCKK